MQRTEGCLQDPVQKRQLPPPLDVAFIQTLHRSVSNERNPVEVGFAVYSVTNIDPVSQTFACDLKVFLRWHDSFFANDPDMVSMAASSCMANGDGAVFERVDGIFTKNIVKEIDPVHAAELQPRISFANAASVEEVTQDLVVYLSPNDPLGWVRAEHHYRGTFHQMMGLHAFPFDLQKLEITLRLPHRTDMGREFTQYYNAEGRAEASVKDWVKLSEWERFEPHGTAGTDSKGRAKYTITLPMLRRHRFYVTNVMAIMSAICFLAFTSFGLPTEQLADRSSIVLTLLLTAVAFKLVISDSIPKVGYFTVMDYYMNGMFALLFAISIENGIGAAIYNIYPIFSEAYANQIEAGTFLAVLVLWGSFHVWFMQKCRRVQQESHTALNGALRVSDAAEKRHVVDSAARSVSATVRGGQYDQLSA